MNMDWVKYIGRGLVSVESDQERGLGLELQGRPKKGQSVANVGVKA